MLKRKLLILMVIVAPFLTVFESKAQLQKVQASFVVNFFRYIQWPELTGDEFVIGVMSPNHEIIGELNKVLTGQKYRNMTVKVVSATSSEAIAKCQMVFVPTGTNVSKKMSDLFVQNSTLVITEEQEWTPNYATINFKVMDSKLTFSINQKNAQDRQIAINSKLVSMAS
jgi:hypothetical protein